MNHILLDLLFMVAGWFIGAAILLLISGVLCWILKKIFHLTFGFKREALMLAAIAVIEPFIYNYGDDRTLTWDWTHFILQTAPSLVFALLLLKWINNGKK